ncbi:hypothetical protein DDZ14_04345 [Maritimibacter sp. 55A14]|nr:hypothetical protein DDZ14_04345 [Maritimibacter sp. 55A14]
MSVYTERHAIPQVIVQEVTEEGTLGNEIRDEREGKDGIVRSVQATLHMDLGQAQAVYDWLDKQISEIKKQKDK